MTTFTTALGTAKDPATRGPAAVLAKDNARKALVAYVRQIAKQIQGTMTVTNNQRQALGLTIPAQPSPIPAPATSPKLTIVSTSGVTASVKLEDSTSGSKRRKPIGTLGASIFSYIGAAPPTEIADWTFQGSTTRDTVNIQFPRVQRAGHEGVADRVLVLSQSPERPGLRPDQHEPPRRRRGRQRGGSEDRGVRKK